LYSNRFKKTGYYSTWGHFDHVEVVAEFELGDRTYKNHFLKDWVWTTDDFATQAGEIIRDVMFDHDRRYKNRTQADREEIGTSGTDISRNVKVS
jgi:hypothetical protein